MGEGLWFILWQTVLFHDVQVKYLARHPLATPNLPVFDVQFADDTVLLAKTGNTFKFKIFFGLCKTKPQNIIFTSTPRKPVNSNIHSNRVVSVLFHNGDARNAIESLPPRQLNDAMAITFCADLPHEGQEAGRAAVSKIVELRLKKALFLEQAEALQKTNPVYAAGVAEINRELLTEWLQDAEEAVPPAVLDFVVTVPIGEDGPGIMRQEGPAQATADHVRAQGDETGFAFESQVKGFNEDETDVSAKIVLLLSKLDELEAAGARLV